MASQTYSDGVTLTAAAEFNKFDNAAYGVLTGVTATASTISATGPANWQHSSTNLPLWFKAVSTNTTTLSITLTPSGGSALAAKNIFTGGIACTGGEVQSGLVYGIVYDATQYNLISSPSLRGTFTASLTGCTAVPTVTAVYSITNNVVSLFIPGMTGTSNTTACTITGIPAVITPSTSRNIVCLTQDNGSGSVGGLVVNTNNTLTLFLGANNQTFTSSGTKGLLTACNITYNLA